MLDRDYRDIVAGLGMTLFGATVFFYSLAHYSMGTITRMGPGMIPSSLGAILCVFGLLVAVPAFFRRGAAVDVRFRVLIALAASILAFMLMIERFGLVPSVFATALIATLAETKVGLKGGLILGLTLSFITWAVFIAGLGLAIPSFDWPF